MRSLDTHLADLAISQQRWANTSIQWNEIYRPLLLSSYKERCFSLILALITF